MRACFLGQNVCALGYGVATLQTPPLLDEQTGQPENPADAFGHPTAPPLLLPPPGAQSLQIRNK